MSDPAAIAEKLTEAQRRAMLNPRWIHAGGHPPFCLVDFTNPWPEGVAEFFTLRSDRLTPLGLAVRQHLQEQSA